MSFPLRKLSLLLCVLLAPSAVLAQQPAARNVLLVTLDGLRWQELFRGLDPRLAASAEYNPRAEALTESFGARAGAADVQARLSAN